jgi:cell wall-associated NlpC family hydrolase
MKTKYLLLSFALLFLLSSFENKKTYPDEKLRLELVSYAKTLLGKPYIYSSSDPTKGFDCSGFVNHVFKKFNIDVPRSSSEFKNIGKNLRPEDFKLGDIIVFYGYKDSTTIGHLGIICEANGMESKFIHASSGKVMGVTITDLNTPQYTKRFYKAIDVIENKNYKVRP